MATKAPTKRKAPAPAQDSTAFGPIAERFRRAGDHERAISLCREGLKKFPNHASARVTLGWALLETGKYDEAREELEAVLRRAPDNLAAIRGLAELHDRAEHTLNLPMDGPGQWPPALEDQNADAEPATPAKAGKAAAADSSRNTPAMIAPAELGLAMWSPVEADPGEEPIETEVPIAAAVTAQPATPAHVAHHVAHQEESAEKKPAQEEPQASVQPAVYVQASHPRVAAEPAAIIQSTHSGMSSMRELDPNAGFVQIQPAAHAAAAAPQETEAVAPGIEVDLAALIAEAEKLDAAAEERDDLPVAIDLDSQIDLNEFGVGGLAPEPFEVGGSSQTSLETPAVAEEPVTLEVTVEPFEVTATASMVEVAPEPTVEVAPEPAVELAPEPTVEFAPEPAVALTAEPAVELVPEPEVELAPEPVAELAPEPAIAPAAESTFEPAHEPAFESTLEPALEPTFEPALEAVYEPVAEPVAAFVSVAPSAPVQTPKPQIDALEKFLRQVQTRRLVLVAESVA